MLPQNTNQKWILATVIIITLLIMMVLAWCFVEYKKNNKEVVNPSTHLTSLKYTIPTNSSSEDTGFVLFNGYKVPTNNVSEAEIYLPMWKQVFQKINGISDEYFNSHIIVTGSEVEEHVKGSYYSKNEKEIYIRYYWQFDWVKANLTDYFDFYIEDVGTITLDKLLLAADTLLRVGGYNLKNFSKTNEFTRTTWVSHVYPIAHIVTKNQLENNIRKVVSVDAEYSINLGRMIEPVGKPVVDVYGTIDDSKNECVHAMILLETADVLSVDNVACRIY